MYNKVKKDLWSVSAIILTGFVTLFWAFISSVSRVQILFCFQKKKKERKKETEYLLVWQLTPVKPGGQSQKYALTRGTSKHEASFKHGLLEHGSTATEKKLSSIL